MKKYNNVCITINLQASSEEALQRCSQEKKFKNIKQIYRRTPMLKCDFSKVAK